MIVTDFCVRRLRFLFAAHGVGLKRELGSTNLHLQFDLTVGTYLTPATHSMYLDVLLLFSSSS